MPDLDTYRDWRVEINSSGSKKDEAAIKGGDQKGRKVIKEFSDMTRGQVILSLRHEGHINWRFLDDCR